MSQGATLPRAAWTCHQEPKWQSHHACRLCCSAGAGLWYWLSLGQKLLFSVHQHLEMKISNLTDRFLAEVTERGCPGSCDTSLWICIWHMPCCRRPVFIYTPTQKNEINIKMNETCKFALKFTSILYGVFLFSDRMFSRRNCMYVM